VNPIITHVSWFYPVKPLLDGYEAATLRATAGAVPSVWSNSNKLCKKFGCPLSTWARVPWCKAFAINCELNVTTHVQLKRIHVGVLVLRYDSVGIKDKKLYLPTLSTIKNSTTNVVVKYNTVVVWHNERARLSPPVLKLY
jgi:hypothetical protein